MHEWNLVCALSSWILANAGEGSSTNACKHLSRRRRVHQTVRRTFPRLNQTGEGFVVRFVDACYIPATKVFSVYADGLTFYLDVDEASRESTARAALGPFVWRYAESKDALSQDCIGPSRYSKAQFVGSLLVVTLACGRLVPPLCRKFSSSFGVKGRISAEGTHFRSKTMHIRVLDEAGGRAGSGRPGFCGRRLP